MLLFIRPIQIEARLSECTEPLPAIFMFYLGVLDSLLSNVCFITLGNWKWKERLLFLPWVKWNIFCLLIFFSLKSLKTKCKLLFQLIFKFLLLALRFHFFTQMTIIKHISSVMERSVETISSLMFQKLNCLLVFILVDKIINYKNYACLIH